ncbi:hypothetical protein Y695_04737 [Hydrogenophaga sp. T4]|nr:hypothetical protein Y695_04737 [Hydrogenophaga sp. T4]
MVVHEEHDAVAGRQAGSQQVSTHSCRTQSPLVVGGHALGTFEDGGALRVLQGPALKQVGEVHGLSPLVTCCRHDNAERAI